jgi:hypothetical protein
MRCNKCGGDNPDDRRFCQTCGHKLQSGRSAAEDSPEAGERDDTGAGDGAAAPGLGPNEASTKARQATSAQSRPTPADSPEIAPDHEAGPSSRLLDFQGWKNPLHGLGPYFEACAYAGALAVAVAACLWTGVLWPLYPLLAILGLAAWLRRL